MTGIAIHNSRMFQEAKRTLMETITVLSLAIEARDKSMFGHSEMVRELAIALAEEIGMAEDDISVIEAAGLLHDIGKLAIPESTLNKAGALSAQEYEEFKKHALIGSEILSAVTSFELIRDIVKYHHERFDGSGYPEGLKGENIPLGSRALAIADTFASLVSKRTYRSAKDPFEAMEILKDNSGKQFDPRLIEAFEKVVRKRYYLKIDLENKKNGISQKPIGLAAAELGLTEREGEVLAYIALGMTNKEIAASLYLSEKTVKTHVTHILKKLNLNDRTKAAVYAIQKGLVSIVKK